MVANVLCAGVLVADIFVPPMPSLPEEGELRATDDFLLATGGCAANVAVGLAKLGIRAAISGRVGSDVFGDFIIADLDKQGIDTAGIRRSDSAGTSKTVVLPVIGQDRRFIHTFGANAEFSSTDITLPDSGVLYVGGFLIMPALGSDSVADLFRRARARGITTVLDVVVPVGEGPRSMNRLAPILPHTDFFMPNDEEAHALTSEIGPRDQAERFSAAGCKTVVITQGRHGTLLMDETTIYEAGVFPMDFVDGSGSGDAFAAGFIAGLVEKREIADIIRFASAIGASACTKLGCTTGVFTRAEADDYLRDHPLKITESPR